MTIHIIKLKKSKITLILAKWILDKLELYGRKFISKDNINYGIIAYKGEKLFDIRKNLDRIKNRLAERK